MWLNLWLASQPKPPLSKPAVQIPNHPPTQWTCPSSCDSLLTLGGRSLAVTAHEPSGCCWMAWNNGGVSFFPLQADLTVDTSVRGLLSVLPVLSEKHSGTLLNWEGKAIPW